MAVTGATPPWATPESARTSVLVGRATFGPDAVLAQGAVARAVRVEHLSIGAGTALLENGVAIGWADHPVVIGRRTVFGHRCLVVGARIGDLCEIGNGSVLMPGARLGDRCFLGEGCIVPAGADVPSDTVLVGRPAHVLRTADDADVERLRLLRGGDLDLPADHRRPFDGDARGGPTMGQIYEYAGIRPQVDDTAVVFDTAELTGDIVIGAGSIIGSGVRIIGDSHGPVRIGSGVQILENTVLHLLPDNELVIEDGVTIGPGCMIHGCHIGAGSIIEPAAIVCDGSTVGADSVVTTGSLVAQRQVVPPDSIASGFPAESAARPGPPLGRPGWAIDPNTLGSLIRIG
jgi:carbonic anhydrase/acetyltransferase-like protein (isoleucine patch superfamily)